MRLQASFFGWQLPTTWAALFSGDESSDMECSDNASEEEEDEDADAEMDCSVDGEEEEEGQTTVPTVQPAVPAPGSVAPAMASPEGAVLGISKYPGQWSSGEPSSPVKPSPGVISSGFSDQAAAISVPATPRMQEPGRVPDAEVRIWC